MRKKLFILIWVFLLFFLLTSSGWSLKNPWEQRIIREQHTWEDACKPALVNGSRNIENVKVIINIPLFLPLNIQLIIIPAHKGDMSLKERGNNHTNQSLYSRKWGNASQTKPRR